LKSLEQYLPKLAKATTHLTHGVVKLKGGVKMSSRKGNVLLANDVLDIAHQASKEINNNSSEEITIGAVKYAFLKQRLGGDIIYDSAESVSLEGNSGPYLQYAHARARSILAKAKGDGTVADVTKFEPAERLLARAVSQFPSVVQQSVIELLPHYLCTYLYDLAQVFNRFYENNRVVGDERELVRLMLVRYYADVLRCGLELLGMASPERL
jgi:arginyl-tRNA synthetase